MYAEKFKIDVVKLMNRLVPEIRIIFCLFINLNSYDDEIASDITREDVCI